MHVSHCILTGVGWHVIALSVLGTTVVTPLRLATDNAAVRAELSTKAAWLQMSLGQAELAAENLATAQKDLQSLVGASSP